jgi:hypothetical protein
MDVHHQAVEPSARIGFWCDLVEVVNREFERVHELIGQFLRRTQRMSPCSNPAPFRPQWSPVFRFSWLVTP